ncbi:MAG: hypothetical protein EA425_12170 [Puniceicoccaceae bacterium]|nr:MAG: hypothetical protein EA425_12170 [Puniceicoccaceae bacterium]
MRITTVLFPHSSCLLVWVLLAAGSCAKSYPAETRFHLQLPILEGQQFDVEWMPDGRLVLFGSQTVWLDPAGTILDREAFGDPRQSSMDMPPSIGVDPQGGLHAVTREGGDWRNGHTILYHYRSPGDAWSEAVEVVAPLPRNYTVGVVGVGPEEAFVVVPEALENVWGPVHLFHLKNDSANRLGSIEGIWRADNRIEFRRAGSRMLLAAGLNDPDGATTVLSAPIDASDPLAAFASDRLRLQPPAKPGSDARRGFPFLTAIAEGSAILAHGTQTGRLFISLLKPGTPPPDPLLVFDDLGAWHLSIGCGGAAATREGRTILAAAIRSELGDQLGHGPLVARLSRDGGKSFGSEWTLHPSADNGEGRVRIRVLEGGGVFHVFFARTPDLGGGIGWARVLMDD